ncbi:PrgI family protein [Candidatus Wolfebacteria bacterium]|nr:PrgI family protein [Candidatus Wolfebacteria bacterium]
MQFQVPQFIEVENKIIGPLTMKQFIYLAAAGAFSFIFYFILEVWLWFILTAIIGGVAVSLAFIKYNGQPLPKIIMAAFGFFWKPKFFLWQRLEEKRTVSVEQERKILGKFFAETPSVKKLWQDLMTTKNPIPKRERGLGVPFLGKQAKERFQLFRKATGEREIARRVDYR